MTKQEQELLDSQEAQLFTLSIPFRSPFIKVAKSMGAEWDSSKKVWTITCKEVELFWEGLDCKIVREVKETKKADNVGNFGTGCYTTAAKAMKYGYDSIEN